ncbi:MAG TPA: ATP-dependent sacrificial sulfur transferase LarE [Pirellulaceae bacterium]
MSAIDSKCDSLLAALGRLESCAVAFSGGVDSAVVAKAAALALGDMAVAVTGKSASLAEGELESAEELAKLIKIRHVVVDTDELNKPDYLKNAPDRCYHCKTELYTQLERLLPQLGVKAIVNGANADDLGDYRPGMIAASEHRIHSPLAECGITKAEVRELAVGWGLPVWDKPAMPCLSSRIAYGEEVTPLRLAMIDKAEQFLRVRGFSNLRVRYHRGDLARVEVPLADLPRLLDGDFRRELATELRRLGFKFITLDLEGFKSGSLNQLVQIG